MHKRIVVLSMIIVAVFAVLAVPLVAQDQPTIELGPITQRVMERGELICGANAAGLPGFAVVNDAGEWTGFDIDICRAVAAAILGDANAISFRPLQAGERQAAIQSGEIDIMSRNTTFTLSRDTTWGVEFMPTTFYDGQGIMVRADTGITELEQLEGATICVQSGTTTELNLAATMQYRGIEYTPQVFTDGAATWQAYLEGRCDAFTTDKSGLIGYKFDAENPGDHYILEATISKEPLGPLVPQSDPQFGDIVRWTIFGLIQAEEFGITSENVEEFLDSDVPEIQRFLGLANNALGSYLGLENDFMVKVIQQVGNYGEIFDRHLGPDTAFGLERGLNNLWTNGGLMYSPPFV